MREEEQEEAEEEEEEERSLFHNHLSLLFFLYLRLPISVTEKNKFIFYTIKIEFIIEIKNYQRSQYFTTVVKDTDYLLMPTYCLCDLEQIACLSVPQQ